MATYRQSLNETLTTERIVLGDSAGWVYQYNDDLTQDNSVDIPSTHITEVYDLGVPSKSKIWPLLRITAKGTRLTVYYRTGNFQTTGTGWTVLTTDQALTSEFIDYDFFINDTAKKIQFKFYNDDPFQISNYSLAEPQLEGWN